MQYRCPGIIDMKQTWQEIIKSMSTLENDIKKNSKSRKLRQTGAAPNEQQQSANPVAMNDVTNNPVDDVEVDLIE